MYFILSWLILGTIGMIGLKKILQIPINGLNIALFVLAVVLLGDVLFVMWLVTLGVLYVRDKYFTKTK